MADLALRAGSFRLPKPEIDHFQALAESILYQQLAGAAAAAIHRRFVALFDGGVRPEAVLALPVDRLRAAGLSGSKAASIVDLATKVAEGAVPLEDIERLGDDDIVERLTLVRGIGRWTAEMFLIFQLRRLDVWPVDDYGVRQGYALAYGLPELPKPKELMGLGDRFRPYRTVPAWYCWRAVHLSRSRGPDASRAAKPGSRTMNVAPEPGLLRTSIDP
jgi:DNA-3-methyladenine glycosylase II